MNLDDFDYDDTFEALDLIDTNDQITCKIAHIYTVKQCLDPGTYIYAKGRTNPRCTRFSVDFTVGNRSMVDGTIAFHFNPRLQEGYVVRNCMLKGLWGEEETTSAAAFTLKADADFELMFYITDSDFFVSVNGRHFCSFRHRVQWERISSIEFVGEITISECKHQYTDVYPYLRSQTPINVYDIPFDVIYKDTDDLKLEMPFFGKISQPLSVGNQIEICGKVKLLPHSFYINLQHSLNIVPHAIIPLHLNPRFSASCGSNAFVRNAWTDGKWHREERSPGFPFSPGYSFTLVIRVEMGGFGVWVNDKLIAEYSYRVANKYGVNAVYIQGDMHLRHICIHKQSRFTRYGFHGEKSAPEL